MVFTGLLSCGLAYWIYNSPDTAPVPHSLKTRVYWHTKINPWNLGQVRDYCRKFGYNDDYYTICDFGRASGKKPFYLYKLNKHERIMSSYCIHGDGSGSTAEHPAFSNRVGSSCSSLGLYRPRLHNGTLCTTESCHVDKKRSYERLRNSFFPM